MRNRTVAVLLFAFALICLPAAGQGVPANTPTVEISGSYSLVRTSFEFEQASTIAGAVRLSPRWSARADFVNLPSPGAKVYLAGPEWRFVPDFLPATPKFSPDRFECFVTAQIGAARQDGGARLAYSFGGGIDFRAQDNVWVRLAEYKYIRTPLFDGPLTLRNNQAVSTGLSLRF